MDALALLTEARAVGLDVHAEDERLIVRGPKCHESLALRLLERKPQVLALLAVDDAEIRGRVEAMRPRVPPTGVIPTMYARELSRVGPDGCLSCGDPLTPGN